MSCRHHLFLEVTCSGGLAQRVGSEIEDLTETCALDVAERGAHSLEEIGELLDLTRERVRQIVDGALGRAAQRLGRDAA